MLKCLFQPLCLCETQSRWCSPHVWFHCEAWRRRCDGVGVLCWGHCQWFYLEFKAQLTSMATTAFCSDTPSHLVCAYHLLFNRTMTQHTSRLWKGYLTKKESEGVKDKQPTNAQNMWELLQYGWKSIPGEAGWENTKSVQSCHQSKGWLLWRI